MDEQTCRELQNRYTCNPETGEIFWKVFLGGKTPGDPVAQRVKKGYLTLKFKDRRLLAHRVVWFLTYGHLPALIDHINGDKLDNRINNLREVTPRENARNNVRFRSGKVSGVKETASGFVVTVNASRSVYLGTFRTLEEAQSWYAFGCHVVDEIIPSKELIFREIKKRKARKSCV